MRLTTLLYIPLLWPRRVVAPFARFYHPDYEGPTGLYAELSVEGGRNYIVRYHYLTDAPSDQHVVQRPHTAKSVAGDRKITFTALDKHGHHRTYVALVFRMGDRAYITGTTTNMDAYPQSHVWDYNIDELIRRPQDGAD